MVKIKNLIESFNFIFFLLIFYMLIAGMILKYIIYMQFNLSGFYSDLLYIPLFIYIAILIGFMSGRQKQTEKKLQKQLTEHLQMENIALDETNRLKNEFVGKMSHDLRTPLNAIIGYSELLYDQIFGKLNKKQKKHIENIHKSGKSLLAMVEDILDISKIEAGKMEFNIELHDLNNIITEVKEENKLMLKEKNQDFKIKVKKKILVRADKLRLKQCLNNLISNSIKFTPERGIISADAKKKENHVIISIKDTGIGIPSDQLESIFEPFYQENDQKLTESGTGLGLYITKNLVEQMDGDIWVESKKGKGSTFYLKLPIKKT